jgi:hypothetical protein
MSQVGRLLFATGIVIEMSILGVIFIRGFLFIADLVGQGPFTQPVTVAKAIVPVVIGGMFLMAALYVIAGPIQRERTAQREVRRRR